MIPVGIDEPRAGLDSGTTRQPSDAPGQRVVELDRRFRDTPAPGQRGAIDDARTIVRGEGGHEQARKVCAVFADASDGYSAVGRLRASGFRIDLAGSIDGDLVVTIQAGRNRLDELATLIATHQGWIDPGPQQPAH